MGNHMAEKENIRLLALETLVEVEKKNIFVKDALHKTLYQKQFLSKQDRAFLTRLVEGVTEYQVRLDYVINCYSKTKVNKCKPLIRCILRMGVYQMLYMDSVPNEAACNECVKLAKKKGFGNLSGFVNGVLRSVDRSIDAIPFPKEEDTAEYLSVTYSMPQWLVDKMLEWYGKERVKKVLEASVNPSDLTIRVNMAKTTPEELRDRIEEKKIEVSKGYYTEEALHLNHINYVNRIPGYKEGEFFVQDESSMLVYHLANPEKEYDTSGEMPLTILDLCAAPGGKTTHFAERMGEKVRIEARDLSEKKVSLIRENLNRLGQVNVETKVWDALIPDREREGLADIVIADLPCSGLGIISKKNDIKYHIREEQLIELVNLQRTILTNAASYVKPGGILLYSTCTINPAENRENAEWFLEHYPFQKDSIMDLLPQTLKAYAMEENMLQLLPGEVKCDGFFIAKFRKC